MEVEGIVSFKDWQKLNLRVGQIIKVEEVKGADKLYKLSVDLGEELGKRILVAGLKQYYKQEELEGKTCIIFTNLEPREIRGIKSQGMLLAAVSKNEKEVRLLQPDNGIELGSRVM